MRSEIVSDTTMDKKAMGLFAAYKGGGNLKENRQWGRGAYGFYLSVISRHCPVGVSLTKVSLRPRLALCSLLTPGPFGAVAFVLRLEIKRCIIYLVYTNSPIRFSQTEHPCNSYPNQTQNRTFPVP